MSEDTESGLGVLQLVKMHAAGQISLELFKSIQLGLWSVRSCPWSNVLPIVGLEGPNDQLQLLPTLISMISEILKSAGNGTSSAGTTERDR